MTEHWKVVGGDIFWLLPLGGVVAGLIAVPFGLIALRVRRHTFVVVTIAMFFIFQLLAFNLAFTGGNNGLSSPFFLWNAADYNNPFYYAALIIAVGTIVLSWLIRNSRFGLRLLAIRDDEDRARGLGVKAMRVKLTAFVDLRDHHRHHRRPVVVLPRPGLPETAFNPIFDLSVALMAFLGGFGTLAGPVIGALILEPILQWEAVTFSGKASYFGEIALGVLFLLVILFMPRGHRPHRARVPDQVAGQAGSGPGAAAGRRRPRPGVPRCPAPAHRPRGACDDRAAEDQRGEQGVRRGPGPQ